LWCLLIHEICLHRSEVNHEIWENKMSFLFWFFDQLLISFHSHNQEPPVINYCHLINVFVFYIFPTETPLEIPVPQNPVESFGIPTIPITSKSIQVNSISAEYMANLQYHCKMLTQKLQNQQFWDILENSTIKIMNVSKISSDLGYFIALMFYLMF
jgi:hypothetical protein